MLIEASISKLSEHLSDIPADLEKKISSSKDSAESVFDKLESVKNAKEIVNRPQLLMHHYIPKFEISREIGKLEGQQKRYKRAKQTSDDTDEIEKLTLKMDNIDKDIANLESKIPSDWKVVSEEYQKLLKVLAKAERVS